jgi:hypothetical protein
MVSNGVEEECLLTVTVFEADLKSDTSSFLQNMKVYSRVSL